jgi:hypothetical protein
MGSNDKCDRDNSGIVKITGLLLRNPKLYSVAARIGEKTEVFSAVARFIKNFVSYMCSL